MAVDLSVDLCGVKLKNPTVLASGILGVSAKTMIRVHEMGAGAITLKSLTSVPRSGNKSPVVLGTEHYFMNAVGLSGMGVNWQRRKSGTESRRSTCHRQRLFSFV